MPFGKHRQRVPAMLAVACAGMLVYAVAYAAPDGRQLAPAACADAPSDASSCVQPEASTSAKGGSTPTTDNGTSGKDDCTGSTPPTTGKGDKDPTPPTTGKGDKDPTPPTTGKGDKDPTPPTTSKGDKDPTPPTTSKGDSTSPKAAQATVASDNAFTTAADGGSASTAAAGDSASPAAKGGSGSNDKPGNDCGSTTTTTAKGGKDTPPTTDKGGKGSTTTTTRKGGKGGKGSTTTTTGGKGDPTPPTTTQGGSVDPGGPGAGSDPSGGSADPGSNIDKPVEPQNVSEDDNISDPGPAADPEAAADPGAGNDDSFDWSAGPINPDGVDGPGGPMAVPGAADSMLPVFGDLFPTSGAKASVPAARPSRSTGRVQELAAPPVVAPHASEPVGVTESSAVSRRLAGLQTSVTESAFPAQIISTPRLFPVNHRDPLAAAALVLLAGVSRELFKAWRRRASQYWPA